MDKTQATENKRVAVEQGLKTYLGRDCYKCGCNERYVTTTSCVRCVRERGKNQQATYRKTKDGLQSRKRYEQGPAGKAARKRYNTSNAVKEARRWQQVRSRYGLTQDEINSMITEQSNLCSICNNVMDGPRDPVVDHCHETNKIRSMLCWSCNVGLGHFKDNVQSLLAAADYLEKYRS